VSAIGLGTLVTVLATTVAADVTGIVLAGLIATLGLFVLPIRRQAKAEMANKIAAMRKNLSGSLRSQFEHEIERSLEEINQVIAPYTRFVRAELQKLNETETRLANIRTAMEHIKTRISEL
jgi:hypothetical protein